MKNKKVFLLPLVCSLLNGCFFDEPYEISGSTPLEKPDPPVTPPPVIPPEPLPPLGAFNIIEIRKSNDDPANNAVTFEWDGDPTGVDFTLCRADDTKPEGCDPLGEVSDDTQVSVYIGEVFKLPDARFFVRAKRGDETTSTAPKEVPPDVVNSLIIEITAEGGKSGDFFGTAVAFNAAGTLLAISADDESGPNNTLPGSGAVYLYQKDKMGTWTFSTKIRASNAAANDSFGESVSLSSDGLTLAIGADDKSSAYVFKKEGDVWREVAIFTSSVATPSPSDNYGFSVALSGNGNTLTVGAFGEDTSTGATYIYHLVDNAWTFATKLKAINAEKNDQFGGSVSLSHDGNVLAVGAIGEDSSSVGGAGDNSVAGAGAVYIYTRAIDLSWKQTAFIKANNAYVGYQFGQDLALSNSGLTLAVGSNNESSNGESPDFNPEFSNTGAAYIFEHVNTNWIQSAILKASNMDKDDQFGFFIDISGDGNTVIVGAPLEDSKSTGVNSEESDNSLLNAGAAYGFVRDNTGWKQISYFKAGRIGQENNLFSRGVSINDDGSTAAMGSASRDNKIGAVFVY